NYDSHNLKPTTLKFLNIKLGLRRLHELKIIPHLMGWTKGGCVAFSFTPHLASPIKVEAQ
ncbi:MAG TPA: hypothetical protein ACFYEH_03515, partial [Candidatus Brocadiaceae bacterium]